MDSQSRFAHTPAVLPVIHLNGTPEQALRNAEIAMWAGADGVFLISHSYDVDWGQLLAIWQMVHTRIPEFWIGVNLLDLGAHEAVACLPPSVPGLWVDDAGIHPGATRAADRLAVTRTIARWKGELYGGVAFKTHDHSVHHPEIAAGLARAAIGFVDVITTSGPATGVPPSIEKIRAMKDALAGRALLGNASGLTPENVKTFRGMFDRILVATGISREGDFYNLNRELLERFIGEARG